MKTNDIDVLKKISCSSGSTTRMFPLVNEKGMPLYNRVYCKESNGKVAPDNEAISKCTVEKLDLGWCWKENTAAVKRENLTMVARLPGIKTVMLQDNRLELDDMQPLLSSKSLEGVSLFPGNRISADEAREFEKKLGGKK